MNLNRPLCVLLLALLPACQAPVDRQMHIIVGVRQLDDDDWDPVDQQFTLGIDSVHIVKGREGVRIGAEYGIALAHSGEEEVPGVPGVDVSAFSIEGHFGVRLMPPGDAKDVTPYIGLGLAVQHMLLEFDGPGGNLEFTDTAVAPYIHIGVDVPTGDGSLTWGADIRFLMGSDFEASDQGATLDGDADYVQFALTMGWTF